MSMYVYTNARYGDVNDFANAFNQEEVEDRMSNWLGQVKLWSVNNHIEFTCTVETQLFYYKFEIEEEKFNGSEDEFETVCETVLNNYKHAHLFKNYILTDDAINGFVEKYTFQDNDFFQNNDDGFDFQNEFFYLANIEYEVERKDTDDMAKTVYEILFETYHNYFLFTRSTFENDTKSENIYHKGNDHNIMKHFLEHCDEIVSSGNCVNLDLDKLRERLSDI